MVARLMRLVEPVLLIVSLACTGTLLIVWPFAIAGTTLREITGLIIIILPIGVSDSVYNFVPQIGWSGYSGASQK